MAYATNDGVNRYKTTDGQIFTNEMDARDHQNKLDRSSGGSSSSGSNPHDGSSSYITRASSLAKAGNYDKAIATITEGIEYLNYRCRSDSNMKVLYNNRGVYYESKGEWGKAVEDFKIAANLGSSQAKENLANAEKNLANLQSSSSPSGSSSSQQIGVDRSEAEELFEKAYAADKAENQGEAIRCFKQVAKLIGADPSNLENLVEAFYQKGVELQKAGDVSEAITFYGGACFFGHEEAKKALEKIASKGKSGGFLGGLFGKK